MAVPRKRLAHVFKGLEPRPSAVNLGFRGIEYAIREISRLEAMSRVCSGGMAECSKCYIWPRHWGHKGNTPLADALTADPRAAVIKLCDGSLALCFGIPCKACKQPVPLYGGGRTEPPQLAAPSARMNAPIKPPTAVPKLTLAA